MREHRFQYLYNGKVVSESSDLSALEYEIRVNYPYPYPEPTMNKYLHDWKELIKNAEDQKNLLTEKK